MDQNVAALRQQLSVARSEIHNLRQQLRALTNNQQKEIEKINNILSTSQCASCQQNTHPENENCVQLRTIGVISTWFPEKKGTPRQPGICMNSHGKLTLFNTVFTNPEHALEGLADFSHMWVLFHFHKNDSIHVRAKVSPPRLNGVRTGVFGTRSPHRPSPIGLSLVSIDRVEESCVYFSGVDMVDGTPVLDIKPYIPQYDSPVNHQPPDISGCTLQSLRLMEGQEAEAIPSTSGQNDSPVNLPPTQIYERLTMRSDERMGEREAPDGEEGTHPSSTFPITQSNERSTVSQVRVPAWIAQPPLAKLTVTFSERAKAQLENITNGMESESILNAINSVLREDPRSVYLRDRWSNQFYTFLICNLHVSCKFDDVLHVVTVFQVRSAVKHCDCGQLEWQCSIHNECD